MPINGKTFYTKDDSSDKTESRWGTSKFTSDIVIPPSETSGSILSAPTSGFSPPHGSINTSPPGSRVEEENAELMPAPKGISTRFTRTIEKQRVKTAARKEAPISAIKILENVNLIKTSSILKPETLKNQQVLSSSVKCKLWLTQSDESIGSEDAVNSPVKPVGMAGLRLVDYSPSSESTRSSRLTTPMKTVFAPKNEVANSFSFKPRQVNFDDVSFQGCVDKADEERIRSNQKKDLILPKAKKGAEGAPSNIERKERTILTDSESEYHDFVNEQSRMLSGYKMNVKNVNAHESVVRKCSIPAERSESTVVCSLDVDNANSLISGEQPSPRLKGISNTVRKKGNIKSQPKALLKGNRDSSNIRTDSGDTVSDASSEFQSHAHGTSTKGNEITRQLKSPFQVKGCPISTVSSHGDTPISSQAVPPSKRLPSVEVSGTSTKGNEVTRQLKSPFQVKGCPISTVSSHGDTPISSQAVPHSKRLPVVEVSGTSTKGNEVTRQLKSPFQVKGCPISTVSSHGDTPISSQAVPHSKRLPVVEVSDNTSRQTCKRSSRKNYSLSPNNDELDSDDKYDFSSGSSDNYHPTQDSEPETLDSSDTEAFSNSKNKSTPRGKGTKYFEIPGNVSDLPQSNVSESSASNAITEDEELFPGDLRENLDPNQNIHSDDNFNSDENSTPKVTKKALKEERKRLRNLGQTYETEKGKVISSRKAKPIICKHKGSTYECAILTPENVDTLHNEYWNLGSYNKRVQYAASRMESSQCERIRLRGFQRQRPRTCVNKYYVEVSGKRYRVCRNSFERVFGESDSFTRTVAGKKKTLLSGFPNDDRRGTHNNLKHKLTPDKISAIRAHIRSFPAYVSHYSRKQTQQRYLPSHLNLAKMYALYRKSKNPYVSISSYRRQFRTMKLKFKPPFSDTCAKCDELDQLIKAGGPCKDELVKKKELHIRKSEKAFALKRQAKKEAENDPTRRVLVFDLQQCLPTPDLKTGKVYYLRQLYTYNLTIFDSQTGLTHCYMWHEGEAARGANEIASCMYNHILDQIPSIVKHLYLFSDCCSGQNRNSIVAAMLHTALEQHQSLKCIDHIFLVPGHTRMECDSKHSVIERYKKQCEHLMSVPSDWYKMVEDAGNGSFKVVKVHDQLYDFNALLDKTKPLIKRLKTVNGEDFKWTKTCWFRYAVANKFKINVKGNYNEASSFDEYSMLRRGWKSPLLGSHVKQLKQPGGHHPISDMKKKDLLSLLPLINEKYHLFYRSLTTDSTVNDVDPDLPSSDEEYDTNESDNESD